MTSFLRIRGEQVEVLAGAMADGAEERISAHLRRVWPEETAAMSEDELARWVRYGVAKGGRYGITAEYDVARLVDLMFALGAQFEEDPSLPWAAEALRDVGLDGRGRVDALMRLATCVNEAEADVAVLDEPSRERVS